MERKNNAKFSGHYVRQRTQNVRAHALRSDQQKYYHMLVSILMSSLGSRYVLLVAARLGTPVSLVPYTS